jgi:CHAT domain-containing protein
MEVMAALPSATLLHISCDVLQDPWQPLRTSLYLSDDGMISVSDLMELNLKDAYLAFFSACETTTGNRGQSDQSMHLAATMLFVGFKSVISTIW